MPREALARRVLPALAREPGGGGGEGIFIERMSSDRKLKASREGSK